MHDTLASELPEQGGPGLFERTYANGHRLVTNVRIAGPARKRGSILINVATALLAILGVGLFLVSLRAQYQLVFAAKHQSAVSLIEAISLDLGMAIFSLLALGLARSGRPARVERVLIMVCAATSSLMNFAASSGSPRSVLVYVVPPLFLAVVIDRVVSVVKRHMGDADTSPWSTFGTVALYGLRVAIAPISSIKGGRQFVLDNAPVPQKALADSASEVKAIAAPVVTLSPVPWPPAMPVSKPRKAVRTTTRRTGTSKTAQFLGLVESEAGPLTAIPLDRVYSLSKQYAGKVGLHEGSARAALRKAILGSAK